MRRTPRSSLLLWPPLALSLLAWSCGGGDRAGREDGAPPTTGGRAATQPAARVARAQLQPVGGSGVSGTVTFTEVPNGVKVEAEIRGLSPGLHGFHVHQWGDCSSADAKSAGGHFNPHGVAHAGPAAPAAHVGDLGNVSADSKGNARLVLSSERLSIGSGPNDVLGRGLIVHAGEDDLMSQPTGAAGARVACAVILEVGADTQPVLAPAG